MNLLLLLCWIAFFVKLYEVSYSVSFYFSVLFVMALLYAVLLDGVRKCRSVWLILLVIYGVPLGGWLWLHLSYSN